MPSPMSVSAQVVLIVAAIIGMSSAAAAQIKILTPASDSCAAIVKALDTNEEPLLLALGG